MSQRSGTTVTPTCKLSTGARRQEDEDPASEKPIRCGNVASVVDYLLLRTESGNCDLQPTENQAY